MTLLLSTISKVCDTTHLWLFFFQCCVYICLCNISIQCKQVIYCVILGMGVRVSFNLNKKKNIGKIMFRIIWFLTRSWFFTPFFHSTVLIFCFYFWENHSSWYEFYVSRKVSTDGGNKYMDKALLPKVNKRFTVGTIT